MKTKILIIIIIFFAAATKAQDCIIETNIGKSLSGYGDVYGTIGDLGLIIKNKKNFFIRTSIGIGNSTSSVFSDQELKEIPNLLIVDKWTANYPYPFVKETFEIGKIGLSPSTNFQNYSYLRISLGKEFIVFKKAMLRISLGVGAMKIENSYIQSQIPSKIINFYGEVNGLLTTTHILSFIDFPLIGDIGLTIPIKRDFSIGAFINVSNGATRLSSLGIRLSYKI